MILCASAGGTAADLVGTAHLHAGRGALHLVCGLLRQQFHIMHIIHLHTSSNCPDGGGDLLRERIRRWSHFDSEISHNNWPCVKHGWHQAVCLGLWEPKVRG